MVNSQRVRCANYQTMISQLQMDPLFLFPIMLGLGLCELHFFFASWFPVCQVLTQGTRDGNWKARLPLAIPCHYCQRCFSTGPGGSSWFLQSSAFCFVYSAFPEPVSQSSSEAVTPAKLHLSSEICVSAPHAPIPKLLKYQLGSSSSSEVWVPDP